jgi:hypothetical protein
MWKWILRMKLMLEVRRVEFRALQVSGRNDNGLKIKHIYHHRLFAPGYGMKALPELCSS